MGTADDWGPGMQIDPGGIGVIASGGREIGLMWAEKATGTETVNGVPYTVITEHWYFYPGWTPLSKQNPTWTWTWKTPRDFGNSDVVQVADLLAYVAAHAGGSTSGCTYELVTCRKRVV